MSRTLRFVTCGSIVCWLLAGCSGAKHASTPGGTGQLTQDAGPSGSQPQAGSGALDPGRVDGGVDHKADAAVTSADAGGDSAGSGSAGSGGSVGNLAKAGNPDGKCSLALPPEAALADVSHPTTVVGTGSAATCTYGALAAAVTQGGVITFNCGDAPLSVVVTATLELPTDRNTVIDGGNKVTLDGGGNVRILRWNSLDWQKNTHTLTLQHLVFAHGKATGTMQIPTGRPAPCSQGYNDGMGGALYMRDGLLRAIDVTFTDNQAALLGPDTGGGAVYTAGCLSTYVVSCTFTNNKASNGGGMASQHCNNFIYDSLFDGNEATGTGANDNKPDQCSFMNNGQNEIGSGGNGGAIYSDGAQVDVTICGTQIRNNKAGAFGAALFFTSNTAPIGTLTIRDSKLFNNIPVNMYWEWKPGISTNANTPEPINSNIMR